MWLFIININIKILAIFYIVYYYLNLLWVMIIVLFIFFRSCRLFFKFAHYIIFIYTAFLNNKKINNL